MNECSQEEERQTRTFAVVTSRWTNYFRNLKELRIKFIDYSALVFREQYGLLIG